MFNHGGNEMAASQGDVEEMRDEDSGIGIAGELIYGMGSLRFSDLNATMLKLLDVLGQEDILLNKRAESADDLRRFLRDERASWQDIKASKWWFEPVVGLESHCLDAMHFEGVFESQTKAIAFLEEFIGAGDFVQARLFDAEYNHWQNLERLDLYTAAGKPTRDLKVMTDTLGWRIVDISRNPGRRIMQEGYVEAVGSVMWFGSGFWRAMGRPKPDLGGLGEFISLNGSVDRIVLHPQPFTSDDGQDEAVQKIAWRTVFFM